MADAAQQPTTEQPEAEGPVLPRRRLAEDVDMDITPMIDIVFLLLIFFIVCHTTASQMSVDLPPAHHGKGVSQQNSVVFSVEPSGGKAPAIVRLGEASGELLPDDPELLAERVREEVERGLAQGKVNVIIKAARDVKHKDVNRVAAAVAQVEGVRLHLAVKEVD